MTTVVRIRPEEPDLRVTVAELLERVAKLEADQAEVKARLPPPRFAIPSGWLIAEQAAHAAGLSLPTIYRKVRRGEIFGVKVGRLVVDPATLPVRK